MNSQKAWLLAAACVACSSSTPVGGPNTGKVGKTAHSVEVARDGECQVTLTKISYDDPGTDDGELMELRVENAPMPGATLGDCGLERIEHINGASGGPCGQLIRVVELGSAKIGADGYVLICTQSGCDVDPGGDGWLQNGPDALRFIDANEDVTLHVGWGGDPNQCLAVSDEVPQQQLVKEIPGQKDDLNVWCGDHFERVLAEQSPLRAPNHCPPSVDAGAEGGAGGEGSAPSVGGSGGSGAAVSPPGFAGAGGTGFWPAPDPVDSGPPQPHAENPDGELAKTDVDGGSSFAGPATPPPPEAPACAAVPGNPAGVMGWALAALVALIGWRRRQGVTGPGALR